MKCLVQNNGDFENRPYESPEIVLLTVKASSVIMAGSLDDDDPFLPGEDK